MTETPVAPRPWPEAQQILPPLSQSERQSLAASIARSGVQHPILTLTDGRIIDGHHRWELSNGKAPIEIRDLPEEEALALALALNIARRQLSPAQLGEVQERLRKSAELRKQTALKLRDQGMTQEQTAATVGVTQSTVHEWEEQARIQGGSNIKIDNASHSEPPASKTSLPPDLRTTVPAHEKERIYERVLAGESHEAVAADYHITRRRVGQIVKDLAKEERRREREEERVKPPAIVKPSPTLHQARAEALPIADESVDVIITSPPYNLGDGDWPMGGEGRTPREQGIGYEDAKPEAEYQTWQVQVFRELYRVAKPGASFFYNHKCRQRDGRVIHPMDWIRHPDNPWILRQEIVWDRGSTHNHSPALFWPEDERIYWMTKGRPVIPEGGIAQPSVWRLFGPVPNTWHPAPFSDELPKRCLQAIGRPGIVVLDPFGGSMTTCKVALAMGYEAIGVDVCAEYVNRAKGENGWN